MKSQSRDLHRNCRSTGRGAMKAKQINCAAGKRDRIYAGMFRVIFVFVAQRRVDQVRRNLLQRRPDPEFLIGAEGDTQKSSIPITDDVRKCDPVEERRFWQQQPDSACKRACQQHRSQYFSERNHSVTVIFPPTPRPLTFRSYIDWANTGGTMKSPRLHDLIW